MGELIKCWRCELEGELNTECKGCGLQVSQYPPTKMRKPAVSISTPPSSSTASSAPMQGDSNQIVASGTQPRSNERSEKLLEEIAKNTNKTRHAVRALVVFLFIQLSFTTMAAFVYGLASSAVNATSCYTSGENCQPDTFLTIVAAITWLVGVVWSSVRGWAELTASE